MSVSRDDMRLALQRYNETARLVSSNPDPEQATRQSLVYIQQFLDWEPGAVEELQRFIDTDPEIACLGEIPGTLFFAGVMAGASLEAARHGADVPDSVPADL